MPNKVIIQRIPFRSKSDPSKSYETLVYADGSLSCSCPGWCKRVVNGVRECKHTMLVEATLIKGGKIDPYQLNKTPKSDRSPVRRRRFDL